MRVRRAHTRPLAGRQPLGLHAAPHPGPDARLHPLGAAGGGGRQVFRRAHPRGRARRPPTLTRLVQAGKLDRLARGLYALPGRAVGEHRSLAEVALRVPKGVVCLLSALRVHDIGTQAPFEVWLALPRNTPAPRLDQPQLRVVRMADEALAQGVVRIKVDGVQVPVFSAARTVVDCFRFRNKIGIDLAIEALRDGWAKRKFNMDDLWRHAQAGRMANVMRPYIEAIAG